MDTSQPHELDTLFESVSRLGSGTITPTLVPCANGWTTQAHPTQETRSLSAEDLITRLAASVTGATEAEDKPRISQERRTRSSPNVVQPDTDATKMLLRYQHNRSELPEPIDLELYALEAVPLQLPSSTAMLLRFVLLEWDDERLDRLMVVLKRNLPVGNEARSSRLLIHDGHWMWRLQVTLYLGPRLSDMQRQPPFQASPWRRDFVTHNRLLAAN